MCVCSVGEDEWTALVRVEAALPQDGQGGSLAEGACLGWRLAEGACLGGPPATLPLLASLAEGACLGGQKAGVLAEQVLEIEIRDKRARLLDGGGGLGALIALKQGPEQGRGGGGTPTFGTPKFGASRQLAAVGATHRALVLALRRIHAPHPERDTPPLPPPIASADKTPGQVVHDKRERKRESERERERERADTDTDTDTDSDIPPPSLSERDTPPPIEIEEVRTLAERTDEVHLRRRMRCIRRMQEVRMLAEKTDEVLCTLLDRRWCFFAAGHRPPPTETRQVETPAAAPAAPATATAAPATAPATPATAGSHLSSLSLSDYCDDEGEGAGEIVGIECVRAVMRAGCRSLHRLSSRLVLLESAVRSKTARTGDRRYSFHSFIHSFLHSCMHSFIYSLVRLD